MKTLKEIVIETILHYTVEGNPRSLSGGQECVYHGDNGEQCAFSRACKESTDLSDYEGDSASMVLCDTGLDILKDEYKIEDSDFWDKIQRIHDDYITDAYNFSDFLWDINSEFKNYFEITEEDLPEVKEWFE